MRFIRGATMLTLAAMMAPAAELTKDQWRENLAVLAKELPARHINLFFHLPKADWERRVAALQERIDQFDDVTIRLEMSKLVAAAGDSHTRINGVLPAGARFLYLGFREFPDGLYVIDTIEPYRKAMGARVVSVDGMVVNEVRRRLDELIGAENDVAHGLFRIPLLSRAGLLRDVGILKSTEEAEFVFERDRQKFQMTLKTLPARAAMEFDQRPAHCALPDPKPLWLKRKDETYWSEYLADAKTLFVQYNSCREDEKLPFAKFTEEVVALARESQPERFVIDLRHNGGGNSAISDPLMKAISKEKALRPRGGTFVLIGAATFSSGEMVAIRLKQSHGAMLVGEPAGQKPNCYGDIRTFDLPFGGIKAGYSTKKFTMLPGSDAPTLAPDRAVVMSAEDYLAGRDPVLENVTRVR
jgi:hypothetical protein